MYSEESLNSITHNSGFDTSSALQIRLDANFVVEEIELYLRASMLKIVEEEGEMIQKRIQIGVPKCNDIGVQAILSRVRLVVNPQVVQGNFSTKNGISEKYETYIYYLRIDLCKMLVDNFEDWEIVSEDAIEEITDSIMNIIEPFMTRLLDNKERESYEKTIRTAETNRVQETGGIKIFGGKNNG